MVVDNPLIENRSGQGASIKWISRGSKIFSTERPKMMILCNPHNPCGVQWDAETLASVARLAKRYGVIVISDEIHGDLMLGGRRHVPFLASCDEAAEVGITFGAP